MTGNFTYENQGTTTYLVYEVNENDQIDTMSLGMLTNNKILGLAPSVFTQMDTTKYIKYNVSAKVSVKQFFSGPVNRKRLLGVFQGIVTAMLAAEDYMIDTSTILLDLDYIFSDVTTCETVLICLPVNENQENMVDLGAFFKNIMFSTQFDQTENCDYVARIINHLNSIPVFSLQNFNALLMEIENEMKPTQPQVPPLAPTPSNQNLGNVVMPQNDVVAPNQKKKSMQGGKQIIAGGAQPQPGPTPMPQPGSIPQPQPVPAPMPQPGSMPQPQPGPAPMPQPGPIPTPQPMPVPNPQPVGNKGQSSSMPIGKTAPMPMPGGKEISLFGLLSHYNKENAALYKAQKEVKKNNAKIAKQQNAIQNPTPNNNGFSIPGQATPAPAVNGIGAKKPNGKAVAVQQPQPSPVPQPMQVKQNIPKEQEPSTNVPMNQGIQMTPGTMVQPGGKANFGETVVLSAGQRGETSVLSQQVVSQTIQPHLIRLKTNEKVFINKPVFRIGKEKSYVDYFISDNTAISRSHVNILVRDGEYFIVDTNSTNHTFVNETMIQSNVETIISHGDKIRLANEEFEFKLF